jgi:hypothetical protein
MKLTSSIKRLGRRVTNGTLAVLFLLFSANLVPLGTAFADPAGNNGTLQVHEQGSVDYKKSNEPHVCTFNFEAFDLDANQTGEVHITNQAPTQPSGTEVLTLDLATDANGDGNTLYVNDATQTPAYSLPDGHYKATLDDKFGTDPGNKAKSKVFWVTCGVTPAQPVITTQVSANPVTVGDTVTDAATVTGTDTNGSVDGTVSFYVCGPDANALPDCSKGGVAVGSAVALTDAATDPPSAVASSIGFTPQAPGSYCFRAEFTPSLDDASYLAASHTNLTSECFVADPAPVYGSITIEKNAIPDSSQAFHFTTTGLSTDATGFDLVDDSTSGLPQQVFSNLGAGTYTVTETATAGWDFADLDCTNDGATVTTSGATATIVLSGEQNVVCTYTNRERGTVTVHKVTVPAGDRTGFPVSLSSSTGGSSTEAAQQTLSTASDVVYHVSQGTYSVSEDLANFPSWQTTGNTCTNLEVTSSNLDVTCTITNTKYTSLTGTKWEVNADGSTMGTTGLAGWQINLYKNGTATGQTATTGNDGSYSFTDLVDDGTYTVQEVNQSGWTPICSAYLQNICGNNPYDFGNFKNASISGYKWNDQNADTKRQKSEPKLAGWTIFIDANGDGQLDNNEVSTVTGSNGSYSFTNLAPGTYRICEVQQAGWVQTYPGTKSGCSNVTVKTSGKTYHRNFGNYQPPAPTASITIVKDAQPDSSQAFSFTTDVNQSGTFSLTDDGSGTANSITFANLPLVGGAYTFSENELDGWMLTDVSCTGDDWGLDGPLYVYPSAGENITCTFTNVAKPATVTVIKKAYPVSPLPFGFTTDLNGASQNFSLTDNGTDATLASRTFTKVAPGVYTISETELDGWALLSADCGQGVTTSLKGTELTLTVAPGTTVTCTFTNQKQGGHILGASTTTGSTPQLVNTGKNLLAVMLTSLALIGTALAVAVSRKQQTIR